MQLLLDNIAAALIAGTLFLMLMVVHVGSQQASIEFTNGDAYRQQQLSFNHTLRRDLSGMVDPPDRTTMTHEPLQNQITFKARLGNNESVSELTYVCEEVGEREGQPLYQIRRYVNRTPSGDDYDGGSMSTLTAWSLVLKNEEGSVVAKPEGTRQVHVRYDGVLPIPERTERPSRRWEGTFWPEMLNAGEIL